MDHTDKGTLAGTGSVQSRKVGQYRMCCSAEKWAVEEQPLEGREALIRLFLIHIFPFLYEQMTDCLDECKKEQWVSKKGV